MLVAKLKTLGDTGSQSTVQLYLIALIIQAYKHMFFT